MKISVVVCTYNNAASLRNTLESLRQLLAPEGVEVELCVVDNNSSDATAEVIAQFLVAPPFPTMGLFERRQGLSNARNCGVSAATGDYVVFTDDDVLVASDWLCRYAENFAAPDVGAAFGRIVPEWRGDPPDFFVPQMQFAYALLDYGDQPFDAGRHHEFFGANFGVARHLLLQVGGFDEKLGRTADRLFVGEERQVFLALLRRGCRIAYDPRCCVRHVIATTRKTPEFLRRYYRDIAVSQVYMADVGARRLILGVPYYRVVELARFFLAYYPTLVWLRLSGDRRQLFLLQLNGITAFRTAWIYLRRLLPGATGMPLISRRRA